MADSVGTRKLAAVLIADIVGYSRLMHADEMATLSAVLAARRDVVDPVIAAFSGRIVKSTGDGILAEFANAVEAVRAAIAVQQRMLDQTGRLPDGSTAPDGNDRTGAPRLVFRIGVNVGDVIVQDGDIFGNGVNVAARIEPLCEPGGLAISRSTFEEVRDRLHLPFVDRGEVEVKNIARPIGVFALSAEALAGLERSSEPERLSVATPRSAARRGRKWLWLAGAGVAAIAIAAVGVVTLRPANVPPVSAPPPPVLSFEDRLKATIARALPDLSAADVAKLVHDYQEGGEHRSLAVSSTSGDHRWTADWPTRETAEEKVLERCQMTYGEPCAVIVSDEIIAEPDASGHWSTRDSAKVRYAKSFALDRIPGVRPSVLQRGDVTGYPGVTTAKAIAIHPQGIFSVVTGAATQHVAEEQALRKCNDDPARKHAVGRCYLYAVGNQIVLPLRRTQALTPETAVK